MALPRAEKLIVFGIAAALLIPLALIVGKRWAGPDAERRAALALMREPVPPVRGRDGSDAIWLLTHDVPASQREEVARQVRRYEDEVHALSVRGGTEAQLQALDDPRDRFPKFARVPDDAPAFCHRKTVNCLARVRANPQVTKQAMAAQMASLRAALTLHEFDGMRIGIRPSLYSGLPYYGIQRSLVVSHYALMFVEGQPLEALAGVCADAAAWRRLGGDSDQLVGNAVGVAWVREDLGLMAQMLAAMPAERSLPPSCGAALTATEDYELDMCPSIKFEYLMLENTPIRDPDDDALWARLMEGTIDRESVWGIRASQLAPYCSAAAVANSRQDKPWSALGVKVVRCGWLEKLADPLGCEVAEESSMPFDKYVDRRTDLAATIALMRTVVWLRTQSLDPASWPALLPKRPASLGLKREPKISNDGARISIPLLDTSRDEEFSLALPASMPSGAAPVPKQAH